ncbi:MAG TPA: hypothetical protein VG742_14230, partial [Dongiaceae bacterium]|nr:hypothetical protein [Dongiaceae bacterium]
PVVEFGEDDVDGCSEIGHGSPSDDLDFGRIEVVRSGQKLADPESDPRRRQWAVTPPSQNFCELFCRSMAESEEFH